MDQAKELVYNNKYVSYIGHQSTADILTTILGVPVNVNRAQSFQNVNEKSLIFSLNRRAPEGAIYSKEDIENIGYTLKLLTRYE